MVIVTTMVTPLFQSPSRGSTVKVTYDPRADFTPIIKLVRSYPVLLIQAENDDMTSPKNSQFILERINSPWRELFAL